MIWMAETEARRPHPVVRRRACQDRFRGHRGDNAQTMILFAEFVARMKEDRLPQRVMLREFVGGKGYSGGQDKDRMGHLKENMSVFGINLEACRNTAQKAEDGFDEKRRERSCSRGSLCDRETQAGERPEKAASGLFTVASLAAGGRRGGGEEGGGGKGIFWEGVGKGVVLPKRLGLAIIFLQCVGLPMPIES